MHVVIDDSKYDGLENLLRVSHKKNTIKCKCNVLLKPLGTNLELDYRKAFFFKVLI